MQDFNDFRQHVDARFDKLEDKLDTYATATIKHETDLGYLRGGAAMLITAVLGILAYLAKAFFEGVHP